MMPWSQGFVGSGDIVKEVVERGGLDVVGCDHSQRLHSLRFYRVTIITPLGLDETALFYMLG